LKFSFYAHIKSTYFQVVFAVDHGGRKG